MWNFYDDLYIGIPSGIKIEVCVVGEKWTTVRANGHIGIAKTLALPEDPIKFAASFVGEYLRETANYMLWDNLARAAVGVAAMNAWYNTAERAEGLESNYASDELPAKTAFVCDCKGENVFPLPTSADFNPSDYQKLRDFDAVVIAGETLTTQALPKLLEIIGDSAKIIIDGYSLPCSPMFFAFGSRVSELRGFYPRFADSLETCSINGKDDPTPAVLPFTLKSEAVKAMRENAKFRA